MSKPAALILAACLLAACDDKPEPVMAPVKDPMMVTASPSLLTRLKVAEVQRGLVSETLRVPGRLSFDEQRLARIGATVTGRVTTLDAQVGDVVRQGSMLARLNSTELSAAQLAFLKARSQLEVDQRAAERARLLLSADVIGSAEVQRREGQFQIASAELRAAADQLRLLGLGQAAIDRLGRSGRIEPVSPVTASLSGVVVARNVAQGQVVQPADVLFTVADLSRLWAVAEIPERQASHVRTGESVEIEVPALDGETLRGKLIFVSQTIDPETRTVLVRTELDNRDGRLKPDMLATMLISDKPVERLVIPATAVVRENNRDHVFVAQDANHFRLTPVTLGAAREGIRPVISGLQGGEKLVLDGAFHLNNSRTQQALGSDE